MRSTPMRFAMMALLALGLAGPARAADSVSPTTPGIQVDAMTGTFGTLDGNCYIDRQATGICRNAGLYMYSTYEPVEVNPLARCDNTNVFPVTSGWLSGSGNCEVIDREGGPGYDTDATLSRGSLACSGFALYFDSGTTPNLYYHVLPDNSQQNIRFGPMTGRIWSDPGPPVTLNDEDPPKDQYSIYIQMSGSARGADGVTYRVTLNLRGVAIGQGSCAGDIPYSDWWFSVTGSGFLSSTATTAA